MAEKFKPISPRDLKGEQKEKVQFIMDDWQKNPVVFNFHGKWKEEIAWFEGNQYTIWSESTSKLVDISERVNREKKNVYNRILPVTRQMWGEIRYPHSFYVAPNTTQAEDVKGANLGSNIIEFTNFNTYRKFQKKVSLAELWAIITGNAFWKEWWNPDLYGFVQHKGNEIAKEDGNLDFDFVNPFNIRTDTFGHTRDSWRYIIEGKRLPKSYVESKFGLKPGSLPKDKLDGADTGLFDRPGEKKATEDTVILLEYHEAGNSERKKGRFMVVAGGWLLYDGDNPAPKYDIGYFHIPGILPKLDSQWYESAVRLMMEPQRRMNRYGSMIDEQLEDQRLKCIIPGQPFQPGEFERYTRAGVDYVFVQPGVEKPYWQPPPPLPDIILNWWGTQENEVETVSSVRKVSMAQLPKYATRASGVLFEGLKRQDETVLVPTAEDIDGSLEEAMSFRLRLAQKHFSIPRLVKLTGKNRRTSAIFVEGIELRDNTDVRVKSGVEVFSAKQSKKEVIMAFVQQGMIEEPRKALELMGQGKGIEEYYEEEFINENQAYRENDMLREGKKYPEPHEDDAHETHLRIHDLPRKQEDFDSWGEKQKKDLEKHKKKHKEFMKPKEEPTVEKTPEAATGAGSPAAPGGPRRSAELTDEEIDALISQMALETQGG